MQSRFLRVPFIMLLDRFRENDAYSGHPARLCGISRPLCKLTVNFRTGQIWWMIFQNCVGFGIPCSTNCNLGSLLFVALKVERTHSEWCVSQKRLWKEKKEEPEMTVTTKGVSPQWGYLVYSAFCAPSRSWQLQSLHRALGFPHSKSSYYCTSTAKLK